jgi:bifunctional DNA-binding transcriptional regulator/antitoxin component of YhaV-PrlF toxin-antitoxin module
MGFPTKVQLIKRQSSRQWYITFPSALAQAMDFSPGETVEWFVEDRSLLVLRRSPPPGPLLKKTPSASSPPSPDNASPNARKPPRGVAPGTGLARRTSAAPS